MNARSFLVLFILVCSGELLYAQGTRTIDSLLLDAQYEKAIQLIDNQLKKTSGPDLRVILQNKKAEALIRSGNFRDAEALLKEVSNASLSAYQKALVETNYGSLYMNQGRNDLSLDALQ